MAKKKPNVYFTSDTHLGHHSEWQDSNDEVHARGIITFERTQFETIQEHDNFIINCFQEWANTWAPGSTLYHLGDFGQVEYLKDTFDVLREAGMKVIFVRGNHETELACPEIEKHVDEFYYYPTYISHRMVVSHHPMAVWPGQVCVHGHLHGSKLDLPNYICANIHLNNYKPLTLQQANGLFQRLPEYSTRFLWEPWAEYYQFTQSKPECVYDGDGRIDLSASRALQKLNRQ